MSSCLGFLRAGRAVAGSGLPRARADAVAGRPSAGVHRCTAAPHPGRCWWQQGWRWQPRCTGCRLPAHWCEATAVRGASHPACHRTHVRCSSSRRLTRRVAWPMLLCAGCWAHPGACTAASQCRCGVGVGRWTSTRSQGSRRGAKHAAWTVRGIVPGVTRCAAWAYVLCVCAVAGSDPRLWHPASSHRPLSPACSRCCLARSVSASWKSTRTTVLPPSAWCLVHRQA